MCDVIPLAVPGSLVVKAISNSSPRAEAGAEVATQLISAATAKMPAIRGLIDLAPSLTSGFTGW